MAVLLVIWTNIPINGCAQDVSRWYVTCFGLTRGLAWLAYLVDHWFTLAARVCQQDNAQLEWVEFFAGQAEATKMFHRFGYSTARLDINYMSETSQAQNPMDLTTDSGMAYLSGSLIQHIRNKHQAYRFGECAYWDVPSKMICDWTVQVINNYKQINK